MKPEPALMGYRGRVAQEKQRIEQCMLLSSPEVQAAWATTKTTRRFNLSGSEEIHFWSNTNVGELLYTISVRSATFNFSRGVEVAALKDSKTLDRAMTHLTLSRVPTHIGKDVFVSLDGVEPFKETDGKTCVSLLVYSGAAVEGDWTPGTVAGTKEEFEKSYK